MRSPAVLLFVLLALAASACDPAGRDVAPPADAPSSSATPSPEATTAASGTFRYGIGEPTGILPPTAATGDDRSVVDAVFDSLTAWDAGGRAIPAAAVSWTHDDALTGWTFHLRPGATFHDGTPVTARDFERAWELLVADGAMGYLLQDVVGYDAVRRGDAAALEGVTAAAPRELEVALVRPRADLPVIVGHPALGPVLSEVHDADPVGYAEMPTGNGPFRLTEPWVRGDFIRAARWDGWLNGRRAADGVAEVVFRIADLDINYLAFTQGRRDFAAVPPDALELAAEQYPSAGGAWNGPGLITGGRPEVYLLAINRTVPPYDQRAVREAVSLILDRSAIAEGNGGGNLSPATSLLPPALPTGRTDVCTLCTYNPSGASDRLADTGTNQLSFAFNADGGHERIRNSLRAALSDIGVSLISNDRQPPPPLGAYQERIAVGDVGLFRLPLSADVPSALSVLHPLLHRDRVPEAGGQNYLRYDDPTVTALLDQAAQTLDEDVRGRLLQRVEDIALNRDQVVVPVVTYQHAVVSAESVQGLRYSPFGLVNLTELVLTG